MQSAIAIPVDIGQSRVSVGIKKVTEYPIIIMKNRQLGWAGFFSTTNFEMLLMMVAAGVQVLCTTRSSFLSSIVFDGVYLECHQPTAAKRIRL